MPATHEETMRVTFAVANDEIAPDCLEDIRWEDGEKITNREICEIIWLAVYERRLRNDRKNPAQRKARRLLHRFLTPEQKRQLHVLKEIRVLGSNGGMYRLLPQTGGVWEIERHGKNWFGVRSICLHEYEERPLPPADRTIGHLLMLTTDEAEFRALANMTERPLACWDGAYLTRMRQARISRQENALGDLQEIEQCPSTV